MKFGEFLKKIFVEKFGIKVASLALAVIVTVLLNIA